MKPDYVSYDCRQEVFNIGSPKTGFSFRQTLLRYFFIKFFPKFVFFHVG